MKKWAIIVGAFLIVAVVFFSALIYYAGSRAEISRDVSNIRQIGIWVYHKHEETGQYPKTLQGISEDSEMNKEVKEMALSPDLHYSPPDTDQPHIDGILLRYVVKHFGSAYYTYGNSAYFK